MKQENPALGEVTPEPESKAPAPVVGTVLPPKLEIFAQCLAQGMTNSDAYRAAVKVRATTKPESIWTKSSQMANRVEVQQRVRELQEQLSIKSGETREKLTEELNEALKGCQEQADWKGAVQAVMAKAKLHGLVTDKIKNDTTTTGRLEVAWDQ